jgi:hypothetical protein
MSVLALLSVGAISGAILVTAVEFRVADGISRTSGAT